MKKLHIHRWMLPVLVLFLANSCAVLKPGLVKQEAFRGNATEMKVVGRNAWILSSGVKFGPYFTGTIDRGITKIRSCDPADGQQGATTANHRSAEHVFAFRQYDSEGDSAEVMCVSRKKTTTVRYANAVTGEVVEREYYEISMMQNGEKLLFLIPKDSSASILIGNNEATVSYRETFDKATGKVFRGYLITRDTETIGAVDVSTDGTVWLSNSMDRREKLTVAALCTSLLVKPVLEAP